MVTSVMTEDITMKEARMLHSTSEDFAKHGKTDVKCPRCGGSLVLKEFDTSCTIGCENACITIDYRGI